MTAIKAADLIAKLEASAAWGYRYECLLAAIGDKAIGDGSTAVCKVLTMEWSVVFLYNFIILKRICWRRDADLLFLYFSILFNSFGVNEDLNV